MSGFVDRNYHRRIIIIFGILGYIVGALVSGTSMYQAAKNKYETQTEVLAKQLRLCESELDKK